MIVFIIALAAIVLVVLFSLVKTAGESDRTLERIKELDLLGKEEGSGGNS